MLVFIGSDHAGFKAKEELKGYIEAKGHELTDLGCFSEDPCDYPDIGREVGEKVSEHDSKGAFGVAICGSGVGISIAANKVQGVRAALVANEYFAEMSRKHNNANVIALAGRYSEMDDMKKYLDVFFATEFEGGEERHVRRMEKLNTM